ncbi:hypothetical protein HAX54_024836 [Datura stramonium]|uniref:Uncharacterized protein n=1 Tax=Datura stramonium TaxID=4076 RepID=A0ABS8UYQ5_DATST|nr:hypothetical protein [Datura stramonium]
MTRNERNAQSTGNQGNTSLPPNDKENDLPFDFKNDSNLAELVKVLTSQQKDIMMHLSQHERKMNQLQQTVNGGSLTMLTQEPPAPPTIVIPAQGTPGNNQNASWIEFRVNSHRDSRSKIKNVQTDLFRDEFMRFMLEPGRCKPERQSFQKKKGCMELLREHVAKFQKERMMVPIVPDDWGISFIEIRQTHLSTLEEASPCSSALVPASQTTVPHVPFTSRQVIGPYRASQIASLLASGHKRSEAQKMHLVRKMSYA